MLRNLIKYKREKIIVWHRLLLYYRGIHTLRVVYFQIVYGKKGLNSYHRFTDPCSYGFSWIFDFLDLFFCPAFFYWLSIKGWRTKKISKRKKSPFILIIINYYYKIICGSTFLLDSSWGLQELFFTGFFNLIFLGRSYLNTMKKIRSLFIQLKEHL